jgi:hypothetical protein
MQPERLKMSEQKAVQSPSSVFAYESQITPEIIEQVCDLRKKMFENFERYVPVRFRENVKEKLAKEKELLISISTRQRELRAKAQKAVHILNKSYFKQKKFDVSFF